MATDLLLLKTVTRILWSRYWDAEIHYHAIHLLVNSLITHHPSHLEHPYESHLS